MRLSKDAKFGLTVAGVSVLAALAAYTTTKKKVLKRCRKKVKTSCKKIPLIGTDEYCTETAADICKA